jgi:hypothetical protein
MWAPGRRDPDLAGATDHRLAIDLKQHLPLQDAQDLVGVVVTMEVADLVRRDRLHLHDKSSQPLLGARDHANVTSPARKRHP